MSDAYAITPLRAPCFRCPSGGRPASSRKARARALVTFYVHTLRSPSPIWFSSAGKTRAGPYGKACRPATVRSPPHVWAQYPSIGANIPTGCTRSSPHYSLPTTAESLQLEPANACPCVSLAPYSTSNTWCHPHHEPYISPSNAPPPALRHQLSPASAVVCHPAPPPAVPGAHAGPSPAAARRGDSYSLHDLHGAHGRVLRLCRRVRGRGVVCPPPHPARSLRYPLAGGSAPRQRLQPPRRARCARPCASPRRCIRGRGGA